MRELIKEGKMPVTSLYIHSSNSYMYPYTLIPLYLLLTLTPADHIRKRPHDWLNLTAFIRHHDFFVYYYSQTQLISTQLQLNTGCERHKTVFTSMANRNPDSPQTSNMTRSIGFPLLFCPNWMFPNYPSSPPS